LRRGILCQAPPCFFIGPPLSALIRRLRRHCHLTIRAGGGESSPQRLDQLSPSLDESLGVLSDGSFINDSSGGSGFSGGRGSSAMPFTSNRLSTNVLMSESSE